MKAKTESNKKTTGKVVFQGFFNPLLNQDIKTAVHALDLSPENSMARFLEMAESGLKISVVTDPSGTHHTLSMYDQRPASDSRGYVMSVKHADISVLIGLAWLLVFEIYENKGWLPYIKNTSDIEW